LATEPIRYITYAEAVALHIMLMRRMGETHFGVFDRSLIESALARPRHAADLEGADIHPTSCDALLWPNKESSLDRR
jgi:hypothetical protein